MIRGSQSWWWMAHIILHGVVNLDDVLRLGVTLKGTTLFISCVISWKAKEMKLRNKFDKINFEFAFLAKAHFSNSKFRTKIWFLRRRFLRTSIMDSPLTFTLYDKVLVVSNIGYSSYNWFSLKLNCCLFDIFFFFNFCLCLYLRYFGIFPSTTALNR